MNARSPGAIGDARLHKRFRMLLEQIGSDIERSIPLVCQNWANTKAAYRFFSNDRISQADILSGHFGSTHERLAGTIGLVLMLHDTTEFTFKRDKTELIWTTKTVNKKGTTGWLTQHALCGILMHSSLAVTTEGVPLGLAVVNFWTRRKFKGTAALKKKINPTRVPIEKKARIGAPHH